MMSREFLNRDRGADRAPGPGRRTLPSPFPWALLFVAVMLLIHPSFALGTGAQESGQGTFLRASLDRDSARFGYSLAMRTATAPARSF